MTYYLSILLSSTLAALGTFLLHNNFKRINPTFASAALTLVATIICHYAKDVLHVTVAQDIPYAFIGGSFIGMSTRKKAKNNLNIILASIFFSLIYLKSSKLFYGYGGALGLSACISISIVITSNKLLTRSKHIIRKRKKLKRNILLKENPTK